MAEDAAWYNYFSGNLAQAAVDASFEDSHTIGCPIPVRLCKKRCILHVLALSVSSLTAPLMHRWITKQEY